MKNVTTTTGLVLIALVALAVFAIRTGDALYSATLAFGAGFWMALAFFEAFGLRP